MYNDLFLETVERFHMLSPGDTVCVGFSGGADSVCLLSLLYENRSRFGITLCAAHVNHCLRGAESDADEAFVRAFCEERDIKLFVSRIDVASAAAQKKESIELCARDIRYRFFDSLGADKIATAHTGSDAAETLLMNLGRGASLHGLCGIPPVRGNIIRPLICFTKDDTEAYCAAQGLQFRTDSSNLTDAHTRNRIRHHVIPSFTDIFPAFEANAIRCMENLRLEDDYLHQQAIAQLAVSEKDGKLYIPSLAGLHPALTYRVLAAFIYKRSVAQYETVHLKSVLDNLYNVGYVQTLPGGKKIKTDGTYLFFSDQKTIETLRETIRINKNTLTDTVFGGVTLRFSVTDRWDGMQWDPRFIDYGKIDDIIEIRCKAPGDKIRLPKRNCSKTLKKLYTEMGIPAQVRDDYPVISDSRGLIWAYRAGADASRLADENTKKIMIISSESET